MRGGEVRVVNVEHVCLFASVCFCSGHSADPIESGTMSRGKVRVVMWNMSACLLLFGTFWRQNESGTMS
jgi:hypothetical protein